VGVGWIGDAQDTFKFSGRTTLGFVLARTFLAETLKKADGGAISRWSRQMERADRVSPAQRAAG